MGNCRTAAWALRSFAWRPPWKMNGLGGDPEATIVLGWFAKSTRSGRSNHRDELVSWSPGPRRLGSWVLTADGNTGPTNGRARFSKRYGVLRAGELGWLGWDWRLGDRGPGIEWGSSGRPAGRLIMEPGGVDVDTGGERLEFSLGVVFPLTFPKCSWSASTRLSNWASTF